MRYIAAEGVIKRDVNKFKIFGLALAYIVALTTSVFFNAKAESLAPIDFEAPTYVLGSINGQDGWSSTGPYDQEVVNNTSGPTEFEDQTFRISNAVTSGSFGDQTFSKPLANEAGETVAENGGMSSGTRQDYFEAEWQFASAVPGAEQPGLSVVASPDRGDGARMSWVQMTDTPTGLEVNFFDYQSGENEVGCTLGTNFISSNVASGLDRTVSHSIKITMQFVDGPDNDVVKVYVDGSLEHTGTSWEGYFNECENNPTRTVDSILFRVGGAAAPATLGSGFFIDNLQLTSGQAAPQTANDCKKGGWEDYGFRNQGLCIQFVNTGKDSRVN